MATEMASELLRISRSAANQANVWYIAHTLPEEGTSTTVLRRLGFSLEGAVIHPEDGTIWKWSERARSKASLRAMLPNPSIKLSANGRAPVPRVMMYTFSV
jgi:hypothetical protein